MADGNAIVPTPQPGQVPPMPDWKQFLIFVGALAVLWFVLSALAEAGFASEAYAIAGLLLGGSLIFMGPQAIDNAQKLIQ
jgi:hypothetical protein